jgi:hypothetical protein
MRKDLKKITHSKNIIETIASPPRVYYEGTAHAGFLIVARQFPGFRRTQFQYH